MPPENATTGLYERLFCVLRPLMFNNRTASILNSLVYLLRFSSIFFPFYQMLNSVSTYSVKIHTANAAPREELEKLIELGVNGILSDLPEVMNRLLADMKKARGL